jgi:hypothetical protein
MPIRSRMLPIDKQERSKKRVTPSVKKRTEAARKAAPNFCCSDMKRDDIVVLWCGVMLRDVVLMWRAESVLVMNCGKGIEKEKKPSRIKIHLVGRMQGVVGLG